MRRGHDPARFGRRPIGRRPDYPELLLVGVIGLCAAAIVFGGVLALLYRSDRILPGVVAAEVDLGMKPRSAAAQALLAGWQQRDILLVSADSTVLTTPAALGMLLDGPATAQQAYDWGRQRNPLRMFLGRGGRVVVPPVWTFDRVVADSGLRSLAAQLAVPPVDASLRLVGAEVQMSPSSAGRLVDVPASLAWLEKNVPRVLAEGRLQLAVVAVQPLVADADAGAALAQARQLLSAPLTIVAVDPVSDEAVTWSIAPEVWATWLRLGVDAGEPPMVRWGVDAQKVGQGLEEHAASLGADRFLDSAQTAAAIDQSLSAGSWYAQVRVFHRPSQHTVGEGETLTSIAFDAGIPYPWIEEANPGLSDVLHVGQTLVIPSPDVLLPLAPVPGQRIFVSLSQQKVWVYEDGELLWDWLASTGMPSSPTATGVFQIRSHEVDAYAPDWGLSMPYFMGIYEPSPNAAVMNGFHGFPTRDGQQLLWMNNLGQPVTFGCIMVSTENAALLYDWAREGAIVEVLP
jgi:lipoprotein-anchoring transpeptidase ErfK/SrfK